MERREVRRVYEERILVEKNIQEERTIFKSRDDILRGVVCMEEDSRKYSTGVLYLSTVVHTTVLDYSVLYSLTV